LKSIVAFFTFSFMVMVVEKLKAKGISLEDSEINYFQLRLANALKKYSWLKRLYAHLFEILVVSPKSRLFLADQFKIYPSLQNSYANLFQILGLDESVLSNASDKNCILTGDLIEQYRSLINELLQINRTEKKNKEE